MSVQDDLRHLARVIQAGFDKLDSQHAALHEIKHRLSRIEATITKGFSEDMSALSDLSAQLNDVTNRIADDSAADQQKLTDVLKQLADLKAAGNPPTQAELDAITSAIGRLNASESVLRGLGADPANPVPAPNDSSTPTT